jgi:hypothetical protein
MRGTINRANVLVPRTRVNINHSFVRTSSYNIDLFTNGWAGSGATDLNFTFSLANTYVYRGGVIITTIANPGSTELSGLYMKYRIKQIQVTIIFGCNNSVIVSNNNNPLPLINAVVDYDDAGPSSLNALQQFSNLMTFQLGNGATAPPNIIFTPRAQLVTTGTTTAFVRPGDFLNTQTPTAEHFALKTQYDNLGSTSVSTSLGRIAWYFQYVFEMSEPK